MGHLTNSFAGGHDPREEAREKAGLPASRWEWELPPHSAETEKGLSPEIREIILKARESGHEITVRKFAGGITTIGTASVEVTLFAGYSAELSLMEAQRWAARLPTPEPETPQPAKATPTPTPTPTTPTTLPVEQKTEPEEPETEPAPIEHTHELVLVGRRGLEVFEPVAGNWEDWSPASVVDHLRKHPHQRVCFHPNRKSFYNPKSKVKTMSSKDAISFLKNSGRL